MSTLVGQVEKIIDMALALEPAGWRVERGRTHVKVFAPNRARPFTLPGTPSTPRSVGNPAARLKAAGLNEQYEQYLLRKQERSRANMTAVKKTAAAKLREAEEAAANRGGQLQYALSKNGIKMSNEMVGPQQAERWLNATEGAEDFKQRPLKQAIVDRYAQEMEDGDWREFMPDGCICLDPKGMLLNGQKRMRALIQSGRTLGFWVARDVPREMFAYFDIAQPRSAADTFAIANLPTGPEMQSAIRLAMMLEAMYRGDLARISWPSWNKAKTTNAAAYAFYSRRPDLGELRDSGRAMFRGSKIVAASAIVFEYYANKAWPDRPGANGHDADDLLQRYLAGIRDGEHLGRFDPPKLVRDWAGDRGAKVPAKRETHLFVLFRYWNELMAGRNRTQDTVSYRSTWPMPLPYHPKGEEAALDNLLRG